MPAREEVPMDEQNERNDMPTESTSQEELAGLNNAVETTVTVTPKKDEWDQVYRAKNQKTWESFRKPEAASQEYCDDTASMHNSGVSDRDGYSPIPSPEAGEDCSDLKVEAPRIIQLSLDQTRDVTVDLVYRPNDSIISVSERAHELLGLKPEGKYKCYVVKGESLEPLDTEQSVESLFDTVQKIVVKEEESDEHSDELKPLIGPEIAENTGNNAWFSFAYPPAYDNSGASSSANPPKAIPGQCGLLNLGNTCFMASALQCLSHMPPLRDYFLSGEYTLDMNEENPLGTRGNLAEAVGELFQQMWSGNFYWIEPNKFKAIIGRFAPRFSGFQQQDSHELMAYVLDGLHEDLNRAKKPYLEDNDELEKLPDGEHAEKSWEIYKSRNDSVIVDTLHGQLKSTLVCPVCHKSSVKFDPFGYLSLPLPPDEPILEQTVIAMFLKRGWMKFSLGIMETTTVAEAERLMREKLLPGKTRHFVFFYIPDPYIDQATLLRPEELVFQRGKDVFAAEVLRDPTIPGTRILIVYNRNDTCVPLSHPMVYTLAPGSRLTRHFLTGFVYTLTKQFFTRKEEDATVEMNDSDRKKELQLHVMHGVDTFSTVQILDDDPIEFANDPSTDDDNYKNFFSVFFQWFGDSQKMFNQYRGSEWIERETAMVTRRKVELGETLDWFTTKEQLDAWTCPNCKKPVPATKQLHLWKLPEILILHLKRFQYTKWSREKLTWEVVIPVRGLDLTAKVVNPNEKKALYDLIAVSRHFGSLTGGHYTASGYNDKTKTWIDFNDTDVNEMLTPGDLMESPEPYILVYRRRASDAAGETIDKDMADPIEVNKESPTGAIESDTPDHHQLDENMKMEED